MIRAVIFDVDGVLLDSFESNLEFFQALMKNVGRRPPTAEDYTPLFHATLLDVIKGLTRLADDVEISRIYRLAQNGDFRTRPGVIPYGVKETIAELSKHYSLGVVTSRIKQFVYEPPLDILKSYFKVTVSQEDTVNHKPNPEPLILAAERLNVYPKECVYVGDAESDLIAARAAGMKFVLYSKEKIEGVEVNTPNFRTIPVLLKTF